MRLCEECKYCQDMVGRLICKSPNTRPQDGEVEVISCKLLREEGGKCGPSGKYWIVREDIDAINL